MGGCSGTKKHTKTPKNINYLLNSKTKAKPKQNQTKAKAKQNARNLFHRPTHSFYVNGWVCFPKNMHFEDKNAFENKQ